MAFHFSRDTKVFMKWHASADGTDDALYEIPVLDGFSFSQATNTSEVMSGALGDAAFGNIDGTLTTASQTAITGVGTLTAGTLVKVTNTDALTDYQIATVASASTTTIILDEAIGFANNTGADVSTVTYPQTAFKDPQNSSVVTYFNSNGSKSTTYKVFAIKIVLLSDSTATAPAIKDYRAIALSI